MNRIILSAQNPIYKMSNYGFGLQSRFEQETVYEDVMEQICTTENKEDCKTEVILTEEKQVIEKCNEVLE